MRFFVKSLLSSIIVVEAAGDSQMIKKRREHFTVLQMADQEGSKLYVFHIVYIIFLV